MATMDEGARKLNNYPWTKDKFIFQEQKNAANLRPNFCGKWFGQKVENERIFVSGFCRFQRQICVDQGIMYQMGSWRPPRWISQEKVGAQKISTFLWYTYLTPECTHPRYQRNFFANRTYLLLHESFCYWAIKRKLSLEQVKRGFCCFQSVLTEFKFEMNLKLALKTLGQAQRSIQVCARSRRATKIRAQVLTDGFLRYVSFLSIPTDIFGPPSTTDAPQIGP